MNSTWRSRPSITPKQKRDQSPQTNGICERFHSTMRDEFYSVASGNSSTPTSSNCNLEQLQSDVDAWITEYNEIQPHSGKYCFAKTPMEKFRSAKQIADEQLNRIMPNHSLEDSCPAAEGQP